MADEQRPWVSIEGLGGDTPIAVGLEIRVRGEDRYAYGWLAGDAQDNAEALRDEIDIQLFHDGVFVEWTIVAGIVAVDEWYLTTYQYVLVGRVTEVQPIEVAPTIDETGAQVQQAGVFAGLVVIVVAVSAAVSVVFASVYLGGALDYSVDVRNPDVAPPLTEVRRSAGILLAIFGLLGALYVFGGPARRIAGKIA